MPWSGQKKDTKLLNLSDILHRLFAECNRNKTTMKT